MSEPTPGHPPHQPSPQQYPYGQGPNPYAIPEQPYGAQHPPQQPAYAQEPGQSQQQWRPAPSDYPAAQPVHPAQGYGPTAQGYPASSGTPFPASAPTPYPAPGSQIPGTYPQVSYGVAHPGQPAQPVESKKSYLVAWLLSLLIGVLGADRFYRGFIGLGILKLITFGGAGVWALIDLALLLFTGGKDSKGLPLADYEKYKKPSWIITGVWLVLGFVYMIATGGPDTDTAADAETPAAISSQPSEAPKKTEAAKAPAAKPAEKSDAAKAPAAAPAKATEQPKAPAKPAGPAIPAEQKALSDAVAQGRTDAEGAKTDLQRANVLNKRSAAMCSANEKGDVDNWIGTVRSVDANGEGKAVVVLEIDEDIEIATWNNAFSDIGDETLIDQDSPLFDKALALAPGDKVRFSGKLINGNDGNDKCYRVSNLTEVMSIDSPDYKIKFSSLEKIG